jgi:hypothetical protein
MDYVKNPNNTIGNRTCYLSACSAVPQSTAPPRASLGTKSLVIFGRADAGPVRMRFVVYKLAVGKFSLQVFTFHIQRKSITTSYLSSSPESLLTEGQALETWGLLPPFPPEKSYSFSEIVKHRGKKYASKWCKLVEVCNFYY